MQKLEISSDWTKAEREKLATVIQQRVRRLLSAENSARKRGVHRDSSRLQRVRFKERRLHGLVQCLKQWPADALERNRQSFAHFIKIS